MKRRAQWWRMSMMNVNAMSGSVFLIYICMPKGGRGEVL